MLTEAEHGLTDLAMNNGRYHGDDALLVKFFTHPRLQQTASEEAGRPIFKDTPYIKIMQPGNKDSIVIKPAGLIEKTRFPEHWKKYQARESQEIMEGTPLDEWGGISRAQCEELKFLNIRTVEQLASMSDSNAQGIMGVNGLKAKAEKYLETSKDAATGLALDAANKRIDELMARLEAGEAAPKKRGRPAKKKEADPTIDPTSAAQPPQE